MHCIDPGRLLHQLDLPVGLFRLEDHICVCVCVCVCVCMCVGDGKKEKILCDESPRCFVFLGCGTRQICISMESLLSMSTNRQSYQASLWKRELAAHNKDNSP